jgi:hypothetical protein
MGGHGGPSAPAVAAAPAGSHDAPVAAPPAAPAAVASHPLGFDWFPAETELILTIRVADLWAAPLLSAIRDDPGTQQQVQQMLEEMGPLKGLNPLTDVESVTLAVWNLERIRLPDSSLPPGFGPPGLGSPPNRQQSPPMDVSADATQLSAEGALPMVSSISHLVLRKPLSLTTIDETIRSDEANPQQTILNIDSVLPTLKFQSPLGEMMIVQPTPTTLLMGLTTELDPLLQRGRQSAVVARFEALVKTISLGANSVPPQFALVTFPKTLPPPGSLPPLPPGTPGWAASLASTMQQDLNGFGLAVLVQGGFTIQTLIGVKSEGGSETLANNLSQAVEELGQQFSEMREGGLPGFAVELLDPLVNNLRVEDTGTVVRVTTSLPDSLQTQIQQAPSKIMAAVMLAGMTGGPFGAGPGGMPFDGEMPFDGLPGAPGKGPLIPPGAVSVPAKSATGLPDGAELTAKVYIKTVPVDRPNASPLQLAVALTVQGLPTDEEFLQVGRLSIKKVTTSSRQTLKAGQITLNPADPQEAGSVLSVEAFGSTPEGELVLGEALIPPPRYVVNALGSVEGTFIIRRGTALKPFEVPEATAAAVETTPDDDDLKSAGMKFRRESGKVKNGMGRQAESLTILVAKGHALADLGFTDSAGNPQPNVKAVEFVLGGQPGWRVYLDDEVKLPPDLTLVGQLIGDIQDEPVNFVFSDLQIPAPTQNTGETPGQNPGTDN